ncbi:hypothetical protein EV44_g3128 [Erysiphe necator]|uniref:Uncharacterized protein n=1 Tax=Uncinula necator TaxID=52586 RepID=A0A0B1PFK7_UNCNE|nr:hypothetical protein EV44_g3128 [Erysiphe necator]
MKIIKFREESLWTKSQHKIKVQENIRLWIKFENFETKNANNFKLIANANEETVESKVWNAKTFKNIIDRSVGLQQPSPEVWKSLKEFSEVVPLSSSRKIGSNLLDSGKNSLQTFKITSTKLWSHSEKQVKEINWISRSCVTQDQKQESKPKSESKTNGYLWKKKSVVLKTSFLGIDSSATFQPPSYPTEATLDGNTSTYRPKFVRLPLDQITSTKLWEKSINIPIQRDWISESSVRPESPTFSTSSSVPSSPNSDASSIFSISTKASSIWAVQEMPSRTAVPFVYPFISEVNPSELKLVQDSHRASKISNGPKLAKPTSLAAVLELNQQFSPKSQKKNDNQTPKHGAYPKKKSLKGVVSEEKDIALALSISKSTDPPTRTTATTPTDWKLALEEAILAGKSTNPPTRTTATTPTDWKLALEEAILAGKSTNPPTRTTATTPADWKLALEEAILAGKSTSK